MKRLSPQESQALALRRAGTLNAAICDAMVISDNHLSTLLSNAKRKGHDVPKQPGRKRPERPDTAPIDRLVRIRAALLAAGYRRGLCHIIAERVGTSTNNVRVRLWKHDKAQRQQQRAA